MIAVGEYFEGIEAIELNFSPKQLAPIWSLRATWLATQAPKLCRKETQNAHG